MTLSWPVVLLTVATACTTATLRPGPPPPPAEPTPSPGVLISIPGVPKSPVAGRDFTALVPDGDTLEPQPDQDDGKKLYIWKHGATDLAFVWSARGVDVAHARGTGLVDKLAAKHRMVYESESATQWQKTFDQLADDDTVSWHHRLIGGIQKIGSAEVSTVVFAKCKRSVARCETFLGRISLAGSFVALPERPRPVVVAKTAAPPPPPIPPSPPPSRPAPAPSPKPAPSQDESDERMLRAALGQVANALRESGDRVVLQTCKSESGDALVLLMNVKANRRYKICALTTERAGEISGRILIPGFDPLEMYVDPRILHEGEMVGVHAIAASQVWGSDHDGVTIDVSHSAEGKHPVCFLAAESK